MKTSINLSTSPFVPYRRFAAAAGGLALVVLLLTGFVVVESVSTWQERRTTQARMRELQAERARLLSARQRLEEELRAPATQEVLQQTHFLNDLIRQKNFSWTQLFFDLAEELPPRVRVHSLAPGLREEGGVDVAMRVGGESTEAVIAFLQALEKSRKFHGVVLHSQSHESTERDAVTAEVSALYHQELP